MSEIAPATLEGWYALHQAVTVDWREVRSSDDAARSHMAAELRAVFDSTPAASGAADNGGGVSGDQSDADGTGGAGPGWSAAYQLVGGGADWMFVHFRPTLDALATVEQTLRRSRAGEVLRLEYDYTSVTEAGLYHATAEAAREETPGSEAFRRLIEESAAAERASAHIRMRLYPRPPADMRYVSFYPMTKRRLHPDNWYGLPVEERNRLMREHGLTGRKYAGRVFQIITGSVGLDDWEWGVTLYARDPLEFKRIVTEMRYDEASTRYGEFGSFYTGIRIEPDGWQTLLAG